MPEPSWTSLKRSPGRFFTAWLTMVQLTRSLEWRIGRAGVQLKLEAVIQ